ncbi:putative transcription termination factor [Acanthamoeba castellanii mimivirus]|uniref:Putative ATP-dependent RNA helicase R350 n=5 Tax=Mimivirus TaxID=315393 RepID=YR350_MIMIV|nr:putative transcription termination factor [Acanthamoeba polyphaga mimivirus]Q5UQU2.1 RecName: Full=Putative ATP-dependent RNA helicase R350 [Acanthamoeba polyphaga mimivirus]AHA45514.1 putative transcription termination factor [Hirudovirus strain Sangsue]AHJ40063.1 transcription termination factor [Samba virus]ALR83930.1 putative transcription termination factor [Niemeyer virus]AMZ02795.1 putative transcription termination factor [Mimivirus Bombay]BAV61451.1 putative transcription terminat
MNRRNRSNDLNPEPSIENPNNQIAEEFPGNNSVYKSDGYVDLKNNGRLFPIWILKNFKQYKLPEIIRKENEDPCNVQVKLELRKYQEFVGQYLNPQGPYTSILLYHGLGSGKTASAINLMNILYNYDNGTNFIVLIKASLHNDPWMQDLKEWLGRDPSEQNVDNVTKLDRYKNIHFVHYDSPFADSSFMSVIKTLDLSKPTMYIIDEAHNFIRNVYSNINSKLGKRAKVIYEYIMKDKRENKNTRIVLISATPAINTPFELALMFNLLRPGIFPSSELDFNRTFVTESSYPILNPMKKNMFERRILGLVSYYIGATPDLYARQELKYINLPMSAYQYDIYRIFEKLEAEIQERARRRGKQSQLYRTYTRQACNFVFPYVNMNVNGELRPRPGKFRLSEKLADDFSKGKNLDVPDTEKEILNKYTKAIENYLNETERYFQNINKKDAENGRTIINDLDEFKKGFGTKFNSFLQYYQSEGPRSSLLTEMYNCSPKMLAIAFMTYISPGKVMIYSNYVVMEGIDVMKIYFRLIGFNDFTIAREYMGYCEYHGRIDPKDRVRIKNMFNDKNNVYGNKCKVIMLSPSATEGIQLLDIRQEHIMEPYWTEVRIQQVIGRGVRQCSHRDLPMSERIVDIYRYKVIKPENLDPDDTVRQSTDEYVEDQAKSKANLIESFLGAMKEAAVDCELFKEHNMMSQSYYCFKFPESAVTKTNVGPAYREDIKDDVKYDSGLNSKNSIVERIRVVKVNAVYQINTDNNNPVYSSPTKYWYNKKTGMVYDFETHYPVGQVEFIDNLPNKLDKDTYIMRIDVIIPSITGSVNT